MANNRDLRYSERHTVTLTPDQREGLREYARAHGLSFSIVLREAALREIGREDLSQLDPNTDIPYGRNLDVPRAPKLDTSQRVYATKAVVNLSVAQLKALTAAAHARGISFAALLRDAGLRAAGLPVEHVQPRRRGKRGNRGSFSGRASDLVAAHAHDDSAEFAQRQGSTCRGDRRDQSRA